MSSEKMSTKDRILTAAWETLESNPGVAARMSDIAKKAGVSRQALYLHFPSRTELFIETTKFQDRVFGVDEMLEPSRKAETGFEKLDAYIICWGSYVPKIYAVAKTLLVMKETDDDAADAWADRMEDVREGCQAAIEALDRDGNLTKEMTIKEATDFLCTLISIPTWEKLTLTCGWDQTRYTDMIKCTARRMLTVP